ncbi:MAG: hypothetical protein AB7F53_07305 [Nitrososphaeraceae archaeon]
MEKFSFTLVLVVGISFLVSISVINNNIVFAHIFSSTPNSIFNEKDGYSVGFLPYPALPKVGDNNTLLNFNVQKNGNDVTNTFVSLIIKDSSTNKIVHQVPYKFHEFADITYSYTFQNQSKYSLSLLTKIAGDTKYENNPLIVSFDMDISNFNDMLLATILFFIIFFLIIIIIFVPNIRITVYDFFKRIFVKM